MRIKTQAAQVPFARKAAALKNANDAEAKASAPIDAENLQALVAAKSYRAPPQRHNLDKRAEQIAAAGDGGDDDLLSTVQLAAWLGVSIQFLEIGRSKGYGPAYTKIAPRCVRYRRGDVVRWLESRTHACTAEYGRKTAVA